MYFILSMKQFPSKSKQVENLILELLRGGSGSEEAERLLRTYGINPKKPNRASLLKLIVDIKKEKRNG